MRFICGASLFLVGLSGLRNLVLFALEVPLALTDPIVRSETAPVMGVIEVGQLLFLSIAVSVFTVLVTIAYVRWGMAVYKSSAVQFSFGKGDLFGLLILVGTLVSYAALANASVRLSNLIGSLSHQSLIVPMMAVRVLSNWILLVGCWQAVDTLRMARLNKSD